MSKTDTVSISTEELGALVEWKERLEAELQDLRAQRNELSETIARKEAQARNLRELLDSEGYVKQDARDRTDRSNGSVADAAYELVSKAGQPMHYRDLADRLIDAGVSIWGRDPHANLLSYVARDARFQRIGRGTYALAEWGLKSRSRKKTSRSVKRTTGGEKA